MRRIGGWSMAASLVLAALVSALGAGCAQDVGDINRTQPDKLKKELFEDDAEWYYRQTVIDTDMQGSVIFEAMESPLKRIRWQVEEGVLYAYSTVPLLDGLQDEYTAEDDRKLGAVAAFPITSHFDVQRQYNPSTGEQTNVIVENRSDRPWYDRDYIRVNWAVNAVDGYGMVAGQLGSMSPVYHYESERPGEIDPDRIRITKDYIDVTTQYTFQPDVMACAYNIGALDAVWNCEGGKIRVRHSFVRIKDDDDTEWDDTNDYEPFQMTDNQRLSKEGNPQNGALYTTSVFDPVTQYYMEVECNQDTKDFLEDEYGSTDERCQPATFDLFSRFGYFRTERMKWDERRPNTDSDRRYYANKWNIWQTAYDADGKKIDLKDRTPQPVVYHLNAEYPRDMIPAAKVVEDEWNQVFLDTVRIAKGYGSIQEVKDELANEYDGDERMFKIEQNSCMPAPLSQWRADFGGTRKADRKAIGAIFADYDISATEGDALVDALWAMPKQERVNMCAELEWATERRGEDARFTWERVGDLRYSFFNWVDEFNGYWSGYGPSAADPLTGEIISGNANFSGTPLRRYATSGTDIVQYINGELSKNDIRYGEHVRKYIQNLRNEQQQQALEPTLPADAQRELARRAGSLPSEVSPTNFEEAPSLAEQDDFIKKWGRDRIEMEANRLSEAITEAKKSDTRLIEFYEQPRVKNFMMRDADFQMAVKALAHDYFGAEPDAQEMHQAYLELAVPQDILHRSNRFDRMLAEKNIFAAKNLDRALTSLVTYNGVAQAYEGMDREQIRRYLMDNAFIGTQLHEVGHTLGLRHNFGASTDALNYHDGFWKIKKAVAQGDLTNQEGVTIAANGAVHISDPSLVEQFADKEDATYVSTPELRLGSIMDYTGDMTGRFAGLGKYDKAAIVFAYGEHVQQWKEDVTLPNLLWYEEWTRDYTALPSIYANNAGSDDPAVVAQGIDVMLQEREWVPIKSAISQRRNGIKSNTQNWAAGELGRNNLPYIDRTVPYEFCSDEFRDSQLGCDVFDWGANQTEIVNHSFNQYRFFQPFWRYKGHENDRLFSTYNNYARRVMSTFAVAERPFRYYSIYQWWDLGSYTDDLQRASIDALNFYAEVLATPEPNRYCEFDPSLRGATTGNVPVDAWYFDLEGTYVPNSWHSEETNCQQPIDIGRGPGQYYGFDFTDEYDYRIRRVGTYIDKSIATQGLFDISANYAYSSFFTDSRATNISYWTLFEEELHGFMRGVILGDYTGFAGRYDSVKQQYQPPVVVDPETFGTGVQPSQPTTKRLYNPISFNQEFSTVVGGMLMNSTWEDRAVNFSNYVKVAVTNDELQPFPSSVDVAVLEHPITGQLYQAPQTSDGQSISYEIVQHANDLKQKWADAQADLASKTPGTDEYERAWEIERGYEQVFEDTVAKLDMIRFIFDAGRVQR